MSSGLLPAMDETDRMSPELRQCVHEFGYTIVRTCLSLGVREPRCIRHLVIEIWNGARQPQQRQMPITGEGDQTSRLIAQLDWLLIQKGAGISAATLVSVLWKSGFQIIYRSPTSLMIEASMAEVSGHNERMTKSEKHRRRLKAAMDAAARRLWPHLFREGRP